jgi:hypothetical protein
MEDSGEIAGIARNRRNRKAKSHHGDTHSTPAQSAVAQGRLLNTPESPDLKSKIYCGFARINEDREIADIARHRRHRASSENLEPQRTQGYTEDFLGLIPPSWPWKGNDGQNAGIEERQLDGRAGGRSQCAIRGDREHIELIIPGNGQDPSVR